MLIIHGDDIVTARNQLTDLLLAAAAKGQAVKRLAETDLNLTSLTQILSAPTLFGETPLIVIEGFLSQVRSKNKDRLLEFLSDYQDREIILFESKAVGTLVTKPFPKAEIKEHKPAPLIFTFLDSLRPGGAAKSLPLLSNLFSARQPAELIFAMLVRQVRLLLQAQTPGYLRLSPWQKNKLTAQARAFGQARLLKLHAELYRLDRDLKTGQNPLDLSLQLFDLIANL